MSSAVPVEAYVAALAGFDRMTSARLRGLLALHEPAEAFEIASGRRPAPPPMATIFERWPELATVWRRDGERRDPERCWEECRTLGIDVVMTTDQRFPPQLADDPSCPPALFVRGDLSVLDARRVGIVGTRNSTQQGVATASRFGYELASAGVFVVSGLARGIDGAAHRGVLAAGGAAPAAVVGNGLDSPYPRRNSELWEQVAARGVILSEWPPGTRPDAFRFPLRNRILAALCEVLVVVESRERGGSLITAREAAVRGITVFAVPGSLRSRASAGTNELLRDGADPALEPSDLLIALGLDHRRANRSRFDSRPRPRGDDAAVLDACRSDPLTLDDLASRFELSLGQVAMVVARLERDGWLVDTGGWFELIDQGGDVE
jgi:DNA processing protein